MRPYFSKKNNGFWLELSCTGYLVKVPLQFMIHFPNEGLDDPE